MSGKSHREGISLIELTKMFPDEKSAVRWFEKILWGDQRVCPHCGSTDTKEASHRKMPYWCPDCRHYFSVKTGSVLQNSKVPMRKWAFAVYLYVTNIKGISSMRLHRELDVTQKTAWFMLHRIREGWKATGLPDSFSGPVESDEAYIGGKRKNMSKSKRKAITRQGTYGKTAVVGVKDRATNTVRAVPVPETTLKTVQDYVAPHIAPGAALYTDSFSVYRDFPFSHEIVRHGVGEYVRGNVHTNGIESFWALLKRAHYGTYHWMSKKHLARYLNEFTGRHNVRKLDTIDQMRDLATSLTGKQLLYRDLIKD